MTDWERFKNAAASCGLEAAHYDPPTEFDLNVDRGLVAVLVAGEVVLNEDCEDREALACMRRTLASEPEP